MITVKKQDVGNWLLIDYLSTLYTIREKLRFFEGKYHHAWEKFETESLTSLKEDFDLWDDFIEWKAYVKMSKELSFKIDEVRHGNFEIA
ncbi:MAG: hypothetical protein HQK77_20170 [Desulfobacterales bacterium]|nr:hypothetical protein [Desulfobacterales bacterium]